MLECGAVGNCRSVASLTSSLLRDEIRFQGDYNYLNRDVNIQVHVGQFEIEIQQKKDEI